MVWWSLKIIWKVLEDVGSVCDSLNGLGGGAVLDVPNYNFNELPYLVVLLVELLLGGGQELRRLPLLVRRLDVCGHNILRRLVRAISEEALRLGQRGSRLNDLADLGVVVVAIKREFEVQNFA